VPLIDQAVWIAVSAPRYAGPWPDGSLSAPGAWVAWGAACVAVAVAVAVAVTNRDPDRTYRR
jgi:hypothetical protein